MIITMTYLSSNLFVFFIFSPTQLNLFVQEMDILLANGKKLPTRGRSTFKAFLHRIVFEQGLKNQDILCMVLV